MKKLSLVVVSSEAEHVMNLLAWLSCAEIEKTAVVAEPELLCTADFSQQREELGKSLSALRFAIPYLSPHRTDKQGMFSVSRPVMRRDDLEVLPEPAERAVGAAFRAEQIEGELAGLREEENKLSELLHAYSPWLRLDIPLDFKGTDRTCAVFGTLPERETQALADSLSALSGGAFSLDVIGKESSLSYLFLLYMKAEERQIGAALSAAGFVRLHFDTGGAAAAEAAESVRARLAALREKQACLSEEKRGLAAYCADMETAYDILDTKLGILEQREKTAATPHTVLIEGWLPAKQEKRLREALAGCTCSLTLSDPEEGDDVPVQLCNNAFGDPFESLIGLYSYPKYGSLDPTFIMGIFFSIFFGLMTADVGYGLLITVGCLIMIKLMKPRLGMRRYLKMFAICGVFSMVSGVLFNGWFGDLPAQFAENILGVTDFGGMWYLIDPISDPITFFIISLAAGAVHLIVGMILKMIMLIKKGEIFSAIFDVGSWFVIFIGIALYALVGTAGGIVALVGVLMVVLTNGRHQKNIIMKFFSGLLGLYNIVNYMSDLLSYSRVLALGLSSAVIASVFNVLATLGGRSAISFILFPLVFLLGHALNIALSVLSSFIHSSRLQYVEFFGKFYEDGGRQFVPMAPRLKYTDVSSEDFQ